MTNPRSRITAILNDESLDDDNCEFYLATRELLMNTDLFAIDSSNLNRSQRRALLELRDLLIDADTELITQLRLDHSLCPLHAIDYAICFDDNDAECAAIRLIHPDHDS